MPHIPKPFKRPSISLDTTHREWQVTFARYLSEGDVVSGQGKVVSVDEHLFGAEVTYLSGETVSYGDGMAVYAFTEARVGNSQ